ncbi:hypothetical protein [Gluconobacter frateurii]|uniref:Iron uptake protein n=1 Tax=Gluconobacter frateurii NRIC 0228 TaxID=1307946 RepID=A0ABQ0Q8W1_9PROT|nr:hypothetical protein [Gluconobacter frateurii]GBR09376.1 hypothetical protein AA0228_0656 [Gluconobacter frateurii NRIC 0228]GLP91981.1 hypothetical protein GCM10007868_30560 [Gluconobacter frateurii]
MSRSRSGVVARVLLATGGAYFVTSSTLAAFCIVLFASGMSRVNAVALGTMLGFILYLCLILWVFSSRRPWQVLAIFVLVIASENCMIFVIGHGH